MNRNIKFELFWMIAALLTWLSAMAWVNAEIGTLGVVWGLPISLMVTIPVAACFQWLGRWAEGKPSLLISAFVWGASVAGFCSIWSQESLEVLVAAFATREFGRWFHPLIATPLTEEISKGIFLVWILIYRRNHLRGLLDGIIYGGLIGAGFAFSEQIMYFGQMVVGYIESEQADQSAGIKLAMSFVLRGLMVPFMHSLFVALTGLATSIAAVTPNPLSRGAIVVVGFLGPVVLHGIWDWAALAGDDPFLIYKIYAVVMFPLFVAMVAISLALRRQQGKAIADGICAHALDGHMATSDIVLLKSLKRRRRWRKNIRRRFGNSAAMLTSRYQAEASSLAILAVNARSGGLSSAVEEQSYTVACLRAKMDDLLREDHDRTTSTQHSDSR